MNLYQFLPLDKLQVINVISEDLERATIKAQEMADPTPVIYAGSTPLDEIQELMEKKTAQPKTSKQQFKYNLLLVSDRFVEGKDRDKLKSIIERI